MTVFTRESFHYGNLTFLGATGTVTGSKYLLEAGGERLLIDCGFFQGLKELRLRNWNPLPVPASSIQWVVLTHAHLDHTGYIPRLVKEGSRADLRFSGQPGFVEARPSGLRPHPGRRRGLCQQKGIQQTPAGAASVHLRRSREIARFLQPLRRNKPLEVSPHFLVRCFSAGQILGAAIDRSQRARKGKLKDLVVRGSGPFPELSCGLRYRLRRVRLYVGCVHLRRPPAPRDDAGPHLVPSWKPGGAWRNGGDPFVCRGTDAGTWHIFRELIEQGKMHSLPIHVDSPMAIDVTDLYRRHQEDYDLQTGALEAQGIKPFSPPDLHFDKSVEDSKALNDARYPDGHYLGEWHGYRRARRSSPATLPAGPSQHHSLCGFSGGGHTAQAIQAGSPSRCTVNTLTPRAHRNSRAPKRSCGLRRDFGLAAQIP